MLDAFSDFLNIGGIKPFLTLCRVLFVLLSVILVLKLCFFKHKSVKGGIRNGIYLWPFLVFVVIIFISILCYQATWQLSGFTRMKFVRFMEQFNPRFDNAAKRLVRGSILDCNGKVLAESTIEQERLRNYPYSYATAHIVGYRHPTEGITGIENAADDILSGYNENNDERVKVTGDNVLKDVRYIGTNVVLTIDAELQKYAYELMNGYKGAIVAIEPDTGSIRVLMSSPSFDPNNYDRLLTIDPTSPLLNRALHGRYPAGSTFKTLIAALMVERGINQNIFCPSDGYKAPGASRPIRDHEYYSFEKKGLKWGGFGTLGLDKALAKSSNTYFAHAGVLCGAESFNEIIERLHFNERFELLTGTYGKVSSQRSNVPVLGKGERRELSQLSIGQGRLLVTPFHMALLTSSLANNNGDMMRPRLLETNKVEVLSHVFSKKTIKDVRRAMRSVVTSGTGKAADIQGLEICGKTGTAQNPGGEDHAWFICYNTSGKKRLAVAVIVENVGYGSAYALPIAAAIIRKANEDVNEVIQ